jgi:gliding motility associated protien GldN
MKTIFSLVVISSTVLCLAQPTGSKEIGPSNIVKPMNASGYPGVVDGVYTKKDVLVKKRPIPYEFVRENDYIWGKRTWSYIDLREKFNHPLYYPHEKLDSATGKVELFNQGRYSLYLILSQAVRNQEVWGFYDNKPKDPGALIFKDITDGDGFQYPCRSGKDYESDALELISDFTVSGKNEKTNGMDPSTGDPLKVYHKKGFPTETKKGLEGVVDVFDPNSETQDPLEAELMPGTTEPFVVDFRIVTPAFWQPEQIIKYVLKEDWFFDKERSVMDVRIIGLAPVVYDKAREEMGNPERILFWVYFPQARDVLKNYYAYDTKNTVGGNTFDHVFMSRRFNSVIYKESTLYDRKIEDYRFGADALYESEKVKNDIRTVEHDVWNF